MGFEEKWSELQNEPFLNSVILLFSESPVSFLCNCLFGVGRM